MTAAHAIVIRREQPSARRAHAQHVEIIPGDFIAPHPHIVPCAEAEIHRLRPVDGQPREHCIAIAKINVIWIGLDGNPGFAHAGVDRHQLIGPVDGERTEHQRIHAENTVVFAPIPSASVTIAASVNPGLDRSRRTGDQKILPESVHAMYIRPRQQMVPSEDGGLQSAQGFSLAARSSGAKAPRGLKSAVPDQRR